MLFGKKIRELRDEQGVLQRQLAALLEIDTPMFSKSSQLNTSSAEIAEHFGASGSTIAQKSRVIKDLLKISNVFDPNFSLKEIAGNNPFNHLVMKNGFIFFD